jgi:RNA polymerase sigma-70 factor (ECF subfamily)
MSACAQVSDDHTAMFQAVRPRLFGIAYRVLGSAAEADDVVQDAWMRWHGTDRSKVRHADAFLATTTTRLAINATQSARARRDTSIDTWIHGLVDTAADPAHGAERTDALERAVTTLLQTLSPTERAAYVLREAFDYPYRQISQVLATSEANARQLANRARLRLANGRRREVSAPERQRFLEVFVAAAQTGDLAPLERLLAADADMSVPVAAAA